MTPEERAALKAESSEALAHLDYLIHDEHFRWFISKAITPRVQKEHDIALDISKQEQARNNAAQRHAIVKEIFEWPTAQRNYLVETIKTLDSSQSGGNGRL